MANSPMLKLLELNEWGDQQLWFDKLADWELYPMLLDALLMLKHEELYVSAMHGLGHIERTILQGAFCAMEESLDRDDTELLLLACSYHDVGRVNDRVDDLHGCRSSKQLARITGKTGEELKIMMGAVDAHSRKDAVMEKCLTAHGAQDRERALLIALLLKDSDGLDRVRLGDLNPRHLRKESSKRRVDLAQLVFDRYQEEIGLKKGPILGEEIAALMRKMDLLRDDT